MENLQQIIGYQFKDVSLLKLALTHRSAGKRNNERLEFLGDSILGAVISYELYQKFPNIDEGKLSRLRSHLVRGQTLATFGDKLGLADQLILGAGELRSGGHKRGSIHADCVEAIFGAVFLDADYQTAKSVILRLFKDLLTTVDPKDSLKDAKTQLQEYLQKRGHALPQYNLTNTIGKDHNAVFVVNCHLANQQLQVEQSAKSIKRAEQACAQILLDKLKAS